MESRRLFVAVAVPDDVRAAIERAVAPHRTDERIAWTRPDGWHVTLAFLGDIAGGRVATVVEAVEVTVRDIVPAASRLRLRTGAIVTLSRRVLVVAVTDEPVGALDGLASAIGNALDDAGVQVSGRGRRPHVTVGRPRRRQPVPDDLVRTMRPPVPTVWPVSAVQVVESRLGDGPALYVPVATIPLGA